MRKTIFLKIITMLFVCCLVTFLCSSSLKAEEDSSYYSHLSQEEIEEIFSLTTGDIDDPWKWALDLKTFVLIEENDDELTYWWNTPNIQMSILNNLYGMVITSGYGADMGKPANENEFLVDLSEEPHTAMQQYGFRIPNPAYIGERPLITISVMDVIIPDSPLNILDRLADLVFSGTVVSAPTDNDLKTLLYISPRDYDTSNITFHNWVENNWYEAIENMDDGQILLSSADQSTGKDSNGKYWVKDIIINESGLSEPGLTADYICAELQLLTGSNYGDVAKNIILASGLKNNNRIERIMPYDITRMSPEDVKIFDGIVDPRARIQQDLLGTGYGNMMSGQIKPSFVSLSGFISEITIALNSITNFSVIEELGFKPTEIWNDSIVKFFLTLMVITFLFFVVKSAFSIVSGKNAWVIFGKVISTFLICLFIFSIGSNGEKTYEFIKNLTTTVFNISNISFENNETTNALYGTGDASEKEATKLWLPYFDTWSIYHTNHSIFDYEQTINTSSYSPEVQGMFLPNINGIEQNLWSTILADTFTKKESYSGSIYRVVDHFMAPRILWTEYDESSIDVEVMQNENYNGDIQTNLAFSNLLMQILLLLLVVLKVMLFIEFLFNLGVLLIKLSLSIFDNKNIIRIFKELGASAINIVIANIAISLVVWTCLITNDITGIILCAFYAFLIFNIIKKLSFSNSVFKPKFFEIIKKYARKAKRTMSKLMEEPS